MELEKIQNRLDTIYKYRAFKLAEYANSFKNDKKLSSMLGIAPSRLHSLIRKQNVPFTEKMARAIEYKLHKPQGWLDDSDCNTPLEHNLPIYLIEDLISLENAKPSGYFRYITNINGGYFIKLISSSYKPIIVPNSLLLVDPNTCIPKNDCFYILILCLDEKVGLLKPVIRQFKNDCMINPITSEKEFDVEYSIIGKIEFIINSIP